MLSMKSKIALVTGAGQGVGRQVALHLAEHGCKAVIVNDFYADRAKAVATEVDSLGSRGIAATGDVTDYAQVAAMVKQTVGAAGGLHVLVNNAGNAGPDTNLQNLPAFWETEPADWHKWLGTNLYGVLNVTRAAVPVMLAGGQGGAIVNVISDAGRVGEPRFAVYSGAKAGAAGFSRALAKELGPRGIRVNAVALATIKTPGVQSALADPEIVRKMTRLYPLRRLGEPQDAANAILFLASDAASWITGQTYPVNGGYSISQ